MYPARRRCCDYLLPGFLLPEWTNYDFRIKIPVFPFNVRYMRKLIWAHMTRAARLHFLEGLKLGLCSYLESVMINDGLT